MQTTFIVSLQQRGSVMGDLSGNRAAAEAAWRAVPADTDLVVFPELFISGAPPGDLVRRSGFVERCMAEVERLAAACAEGPAIAMGTPWSEDGRITNACAVLKDGKVLTVQHKVEVSGEPPFAEDRVFASAAMPGPVDINGVRVGLPIGDDLFGVDVVECLAETGADILIAPVAWPYTRLEAERRMNVAVTRVVESGLSLAVVNAVGGQDEWVFDGASFALGADRRLTHQMPAFEPAETRLVFRSVGGRWIPDPAERAPLEEGHAADWSALVLGVRERVEHDRFQRTAVVLSPDLSGAVTLALAVDALGADRVEALTWCDGRRDGETGAFLGRLGTSERRVALVPVVDAAKAASTDGSSGPVDTEWLGEEIAAAVLEATAKASGATLLVASSALAIALGEGPMRGALNPVGDLFPSELRALARWRNARAAERGEGEFIPSSWLSEGVAEADSVRETIVRRMIDRDCGMDELLAEGYDAETVRRAVSLVTAGEDRRRRSTMVLRISPPRLSADRVYPISNRYRDA